jgi:formylglycine-generating enzyme required for sulfatase activity
VRAAGARETKQVGSLAADSDPFGLADMAGNAWEWTSSWYAPVYGTDGAQATTGTERVLRGGPWDGTRQFLTTTFRGKLRPETRNFNTGFRCALDAPK